MCTTCEVQTTCGMLKMAVASVQTKSKCTQSLHCQTEKLTRKSAHSIQKQKVKEMSFKKNSRMIYSRIVFVNSCPGLVSSGISLISQKPF